MRAAALAFAVIVTVPLQAADTDYRLQPEPVAPGTYLVAGVPENFSRSNGGNIVNTAFVVTGAGVVVIDTGPSKRYGQQLRAAIARVTAEPVVAVYLTHHHPDHALGNQAFADVPIRALPGTIEGLREQGNDFNSNLFRMVGDWMRGTELVLPQAVVEGAPEDIGNRRLRPLLMRGHTPSDLALFDEKTGILFAGDLVFLDRAPTTPHADIERWRMSLANLSAIPSAMIVPGHGPVESSVRGVEQTSRWLETISHIIGDAFERGLDISEAITLPLPDWTKSIALARYEYERSVMHLYPQFEAARWPRIDERG